VRRGLVDPLEVIDRDEHRARPRRNTDRLERGGCDCPAIRGPVTRIGPEQRDVERASLRWRELTLYLVHDLPEDIRQHGERHGRIGLGCDPAENREPAPRGRRHCVAKQRRLPDSGRARDLERRRLRGDRLQKRLNRRELIDATERGQARHQGRA
jgi:hypothetical protein